ncbi:TPA: hypothetical protein N0F65_002994 [Lagenidium giganteum]|uniref:FYVE-type domain-containing protein n=1 Tax=Lagenidium giganteum TaxID=4803 RepID=A0AAV2YSS2_9STRA|nr:TPA: hypothetical protein N0F65_002994 [Lagenidium giganteum]
MDVSGFLPRVELSASQRQAFDAQCDDLIQRALDEHQLFHTAEGLERWKCVRQRDALSVYRDRGDVARGTTSPWIVCSGLLPGTVDDVLNGIYCDSTETLRVVKSILSDKFLDGAMVSVLERHRLSAPIIFAGIKWFAVKSPGGSMIQDRDALVYERMGRIVDRSGQQFAYHVLHSIDLPEWPPATTQRLCRASTAMCYLYRRVTEDWVGCFMLGHFDANGRLPQTISEFLVADMFLSVSKVLECSQAKRLSSLVASNTDATPSTSRCCDLCMTAPKLLDPHKRCAACRQRVCRKCRNKRTIFRLNARTRKPEQERFCRDCVNLVVYGGEAVPTRRWPGGFHTPGTARRREQPRSTPIQSSHSLPPDCSDSPSSWGMSSQNSYSNSGWMELDIEGLAEQAENPDGLVWNQEELTRLSSVFRSSKSKRTREGKTSKRLVNNNNPVDSVLAPLNSAATTPRSAYTPGTGRSTSGGVTPSSTQSSTTTPRSKPSFVFGRISSRHRKDSCATTTPRGTSSRCSPGSAGAYGYSSRAADYQDFADAVAARQAERPTAFKTTVMFKTAVNSQYAGRTRGAAPSPASSSSSYNSAQWSNGQHTQQAPVRVREKAFDIDSLD